MTGRVERLQQSYDLDIRWTAFPLHPETPEQGRSIEDLFAGSGMDIAAKLAQLESVAEKLGLPFGARLMTYNSRRAQELGKWAAHMGREQAFHDAAFRAYFARGENIALPGILAAVAAEAGLDAGQARRVLDEGRFAEAVDQDWQRSRDMDIRVVPTFVLGQGRLTGAQPFEALRRFVEGDGGIGVGGLA